MTKAIISEEDAQDMLTLGTAGPVQMGFWVPNRVWATAKYLAPLCRSIEARRQANELPEWEPVLVDLSAWIASHSVYRMWMTSMIDEVNAFIAANPGDVAPIKGYGDVTSISGITGLFDMLNEIITTSPGFNTTVMVGTPMNGLFAVAMATEAGTALFHDTTFNEQFKNVLNAWNAFQKSPASLDKLDINDPEKPGSWISKAAFAAGVWDDIQYDASKPGYGFASWNDFFIRHFVPGARPFIGDSSTSVDVGCETTPWQYQNDVQLSSKFWIKDATYSLIDLFGGNADVANDFVGGQIYQGFLSATHYHRWAAPLDGTLIQSWLQPGTYFAQRPDQGQNPGTWEGTASQPYLGHVATRAVYIFEHQLFGKVAFICIGMAEVSTCYIEPQYLIPEGGSSVSVARGDDIGHFEFGGSTHVMVFQNNNNIHLVDWAINAAEHRTDPNAQKMGSLLASYSSSGGK